VRASEDQEQATDRWCSHTTWGQEFWQILAQWVWNLRLELGHAFHPTPMRTTEFASAQMGEPAEPAPASRPASTSPHCLQAAAVSPPIVHQRVCRSRFLFPAGWDAALSCRAVPVCARAARRRAMVRCGCSTQRGSAIVAHVRFANSVKNRRPPSKRGGSVPSIGLSLHMRRFQVSPHLPQGTLHLHWLLIRCSEEIGNGAPR
jgi:hypothetical protein